MQQTIHMDITRQPYLCDYMLHLLTKYAARCDGMPESSVKYTSDMPESPVKYTSEGYGPQVDDQGRQYVDIRLENANLITDFHVPADSSAILQIFLNSVEMKKVVIEKDNDLLSKDEIQKHMDDVMTAA